MEIEVKDSNPPILSIFPCHDNDSGSLNVSNIDPSGWQIGKHDYTCLNQLAESCKGSKKHLCWLHFSQDVSGIGSSGTSDCIYGVKADLSIKNVALEGVAFIYRAAMTCIRASGEVVKSPLRRGFPRKGPVCDCSDASWIPGRRVGIISFATHRGGIIGFLG